MNGIVIAIGGAVRLDGPILDAFYEASGGADGEIVILPTASAQPEAGMEYAARLAELGLKTPARVLPIRERSDTCVTEYLQAIRSATGIFITGGNQMRLSAILGGTPVHEELMSAHRRGVTIAGTSAGTGALSSVMIAFGHSGAYARQRIAQFAPGLGFFASIIFDQHFRQRNRLGRLIYAVTSNPGLLGIGIDEDTAAVMEENQLRVLGSGAVTIVDGSTLVESNVSEASGGAVIAYSGIRLHVLTQGCTFDLQKRSAHVFDWQTDTKV